MEYIKFRESGKIEPVNKFIQTRIIDTKRVSKIKEK